VQKCWAEGGTQRIVREGKGKAQMCGNVELRGGTQGIRRGGRI